MIFRGNGSASRYVPNPTLDQRSSMVKLKCSQLGSCHSLQPDDGGEIIPSVSLCQFATRWPSRTNSQARACCQPHVRPLAPPSRITLSTSENITGRSFQQLTSEDKLLPCLGWCACVRLCVCVYVCVKGGGTRGGLRGRPPESDSY